MTWWEALDIIDTGGFGHDRDSRVRLEALRVLAGLPPTLEEPPTLPPPKPEERQPE